jgi:hypothetical protein
VRHFQKIRTAVASGVAALLIEAFMAGASAHGGDATLVHACINNNSGGVRIVGPNQACLHNETARDWSIQGPTGPAGPSGSAGLRLVDSIGAEVGVYGGRVFFPHWRDSVGSYAETVLVPSPGRMGDFLRLRLDAESGLLNTGVTLYFESADCTGPGFGSFPNLNLYTSSAAANSPIIDAFLNNTVVYYPSGPFVALAARSVKQISGGFAMCETMSPPFSTVMVLAETASIPSAVPPFSLVR